MNHIQFQFEQFILSLFEGTVIVQLVGSHGFVNSCPRSYPIIVRRVEYFLGRIFFCIMHFALLCRASLFYKFKLKVFV